MDEHISAASLMENLNDFSSKTEESLPIEKQPNKENEFQNSIPSENNACPEDFININEQSNVPSHEETVSKPKDTNEINDMVFLSNANESEVATNDHQTSSSNENRFEIKNEESIPKPEDTNVNQVIETQNHSETTSNNNQNEINETQIVAQETIVIKSENTLNESKHGSNIETNETTNNIEMNDACSTKDEMNVEEKTQVDLKSSPHHVMSNLENSIMTVSNEQNADESNDAVAAVVAAVEQSVAAKAVSGNEVNVKAPNTSKSAKKKARNSSPNKSTNQSSSVNNHLNNGSLNNSISESTNNTSPSSAQKRRKKDPHAPKAPLNGYLVYFNEERADMRSKNPQMSFGELTKIIAAKWKDLPVEDKQRYINEADVDKERYNKEMVDYKNSNAYKQYLKENSLAKLNKNGEIETNSHIHEPNQAKMANGDGPNLNWLQQETNIAGFDVPIFTEEFIEYSKNREQEMRQLRKEIAEMEKQNAVLHNHIDNLKQSTTKIESDIERFKNSNSQMQKNADLFRQTILHCFNNIALPNTQEYPTPNNIDDYIMKTYAILNATMQTENSNESAYSLNRQFANHVKSVFSKINFSSLFESI